MLAKTSKKIKKIAFFGDGEARATDQHFIDAVDTAEILAKNKFVIVNGGGPGIMLAATLGAKKAKGKVELVIINNDKTIMGKYYEGTSQENLKLADKTYKTKTIEERTAKLVELADAYVIFRGGTGTMAEMSLVWEKAKFEYGKHEPLIFYGDDWRKVVESLVCNLKLENIEQKVYAFAESPEEVLKIIKNKKSKKQNGNLGILGKIRELVDSF